MKRFLPFLILFFVSLIFTKPYFRQGFFNTHDGEWAVIRVSEMQREFKDLQFPPRWSDYLNHGYGYPLFNFTYPFPFYLGAVLKFFHFSLIDSVKVIFVGSVFISALLMYLLGRELGGNFAGLLASVFYVVAPFRLVDLYIRGSIGESVSLALFPLLCYLGIKYILRPTIGKMILCASFLAILILTHNIMSLIFFPLWLIFLYVAVFLYFEDVKLYTWRYFFPMILLGLGFAAYFFLPALLEKKYILLSQVKLAELKDNFITLPQYLLSPWSYGIKPSFQLGWAHILATIIAFMGYIFSKAIDRKKYLPLVLFIYFGIFFLIFFAHPYSKEFWNVPPLKWFDFPWRFLTPLAFFLALSSVLLSIHKTTRIIGGILVILTVWLSLNYVGPASYTNKEETFYSTNDATTTSKDELMPTWVKNKPTDRYLIKVEIENGQGIVFKVNHKSNYIDFKLAAQTPVDVKINTIYYPGWQFLVNEEKTEVNYDQPDGLMRFHIEKPGSYLVKGKLTETPLRLAADGITLVSVSISFILLMYSGISSRRKRKK